MIAVDTSALMAVLLDEPLAQDCADALQAAGTLMISAGTVAEALIVADRRGLGAEMRRLIDGLGFEVECVTASTARRVADAYARWGKGVDPAGLNFGHALARAHDARLLSVGDDFARTDVTSALEGRRSSAPDR